MDLLQIEPLKVLPARENRPFDLSLGPARVIVFEDTHYRGDRWETDGCWNLGSEWNDRISSFIIESGTWCFAEHHNYEGWRFDFGPGAYFNMGGIPNDAISSFGYYAFGPENLEYGIAPESPLPPIWYQNMHFWWFQTNTNPLRYHFRDPRWQYNFIGERIDGTEPEFGSIGDLWVEGNEMRYEWEGGRKRTIYRRV